MVKTFPKSRVCVIDVYPMFEKGLKEALNFCKRFNLSLNTNDGKKILLSYCINKIDEGYKQEKSIYPKVLALNNKQIKPTLKLFIESHFDTMMEQLPYSYCGVVDFNSPDLETAAEKSLKAPKSKRRFTNFLAKINKKV